MAETTETKALLAEDDPNLGSVLQEYLTIKGIQTTLCKDGEEAWDKFRDDKFDICLLDVMMPTKDGFTLAREIRKVNNSVPIIFLTAKSMKEDKLEGFKLGGDDYLTKPFSMEELLVRIQAVLRRCRTPEADEQEQTRFTIGKYDFDYNLHTLKPADGEKRTLTSKEAELLRMLAMHKNQILTREKALVEIWGDNDYFMGRSMDVFIAKLRKYLSDDRNVHIMNIHGRGFKLVVEGEKS